MDNWIDLNEQKPEEDRAVFVRGRPYANKGEMLALAVFCCGNFYMVDDSFGWVESYADTEADRMFELEDVTHWAPLPDFMYAQQMS